MSCCVAGLWTVNPHDASSAGFCDVWVYCHRVVSDASLIIAILLATNVLNLRVSLLIYFNTVLLSIQKQDFTSDTKATASCLNLRSTPIKELARFGPCRS